MCKPLDDLQPVPYPSLAVLQLEGDLLCIEMGPPIISAHSDSFIRMIAAHFASQALARRANSARIQEMKA